MTSKEALEQLEQYITNEKGRLSIFIKLYFKIIKQDLERLETLETFIAWLRGQTFRKTEEVDKIFKKLKEVLDNEKTRTKIN